MQDASCAPLEIDFVSGARAFIDQALPLGWEKERKFASAAFYLKIMQVSQSLTD